VGGPFGQGVGRVNGQAPEARRRVRLRLDEQVTALLVLDELDRGPVQVGHQDARGRKLGALGLEDGDHDAVEVRHRAVHDRDLQVVIIVDRLRDEAEQVVADAVAGDDLIFGFNQEVSAQLCADEVFEPLLVFEDLLGRPHLHHDRLDLLADLLEGPVAERDGASLAGLAARVVGDCLHAHEVDRVGGHRDRVEQVEDRDLPERGADDLVLLLLNDGRACRAAHVRDLLQEHPGEVRAPLPPDGIGSVLVGGLEAVGNLLARGPASLAIAQLAEVFDLVHALVDLLGHVFHDLLNLLLLDRLIELVNPLGVVEGALLNLFLHVFEAPLDGAHLCHQAVVWVQEFLHIRFDVVDLLLRAGRERHFCQEDPRVGLSAHQIRSKTRKRVCGLGR